MNRNIIMIKVARNLSAEEFREIEEIFKKEYPNSFVFLSLELEEWGFEFKFIEVPKFISAP